MDEILGKIIHILSSTIIVRVMSYPTFSIEILLAAAVCVIHVLLLLDINTLVRRTNARAAARVKMRHHVKDADTCSFHSFVTLETTQVFHKKPEVFQRPQVYTPVNRQRLKRALSRNNLGWLLSKGDSMLKHDFHDRVEHLLSISPSEYVRRDKERKNREQGLRSCIQSLTSLLEKALTSDTLEMRNVSKEDIKKSINTLRETFESQINNSYQLCNFPSPSLQSLIDKSTANDAFKNSLDSKLISSIYRASGADYSRNNDDKKQQEEEEVGAKNSVDTLSLRTNQSFSEIFRKKSNDMCIQG